MKKYWLVSKIWLLFPLSIIACSQPASPSENENSSQSTGTAYEENTVSTMKKDDVKRNEAGKDSIAPAKEAKYARIDTLPKPVPEHSAPRQAEIDSIKEAKTRRKQTPLKVK